MAPDGGYVTSPPAERQGAWKERHRSPAKDVCGDDPVGPARCCSVLWGQHRGYLLEHVGAGDKTALLKDHVRKTTRNFTRLLPGLDAEGAVRSKDWRVVVNARVEPEA